MYWLLDKLNQYEKKHGEDSLPAGVLGLAVILAAFYYFFKWIFENDRTN